uniref:Uncharacterized protein n=1 Tax=Meloidogyne enterolobii TaxID=390850 RepID=A0A6V7X7V9_MELEN|nr:unnamed protein product [Meloidogyne enterolobii]
MAGSAPSRFIYHSAAPPQQPTISASPPRYNNAPEQPPHQAANTQTPTKRSERIAAQQIAKAQQVARSQQERHSETGPQQTTAGTSSGINSRRPHPRTPHFITGYLAPSSDDDDQESK